MTLIYNIEPFVEDWVFTKGDTINMSRGILKNDVAFDMTGMQIDIHIRTYDDRVIKTMSTASLIPEITIAADVFTIYCAGFSESGDFQFDVQITDGTNILTIGKGRVHVTKEMTI